MNFTCIIAVSLKENCEIFEQGKGEVMKSKQNNPTALRDQGL